MSPAWDPRQAETETTAGPQVPAVVGRHSQVEACHQVAAGSPYMLKVLVEPTRQEHPGRAGCRGLWSPAFSVADLVTHRRIEQGIAPDGSRPFWLKPQSLTAIILP